MIPPPLGIARSRKIVFYEREERCLFACEMVHYCVLASCFSCHVHTIVALSWAQRHHFGMSRVLPRPHHLSAGPVACLIFVGSAVSYACDRHIMGHLRRELLWRDAGEVEF